MALGQTMEKHNFQIYDDEIEYYSFNEFDGEKGWVSTVSTHDILNEYWNYWYDSMCKKYGKEVVDKEYSWKDCIDDYVIGHWAWKVEK